MVAWTFTSNGKKIVMTKDGWAYEDGTLCINEKTICKKCNKPQLDINGVENCDFCLQGLTTCDFIDYACCGHGDDSLAYISLKDGRRFVLDTKDYSSDKK